MIEVAPISLAYESAKKPKSLALVLAEFGNLSHTAVHDSSGTDANPATGTLATANNTTRTSRTNMTSLMDFSDVHFTAESPTPKTPSTSSRRKRRSIKKTPSFTEAMDREIDPPTHSWMRSRSGSQRGSRSSFGSQQTRKSSTSSLNVDMDQLHDSLNRIHLLHDDSSSIDNFGMDNTDDVDWKSLSPPSPEKEEPSMFSSSVSQATDAATVATDATFTLDATAQKAAKALLLSSLAPTSEVRLCHLHKQANHNPLECLCCKLRQRFYNVDAPIIGNIKRSQSLITPIKVNHHNHKDAGKKAKGLPPRAHTQPADATAHMTPTTTPGTYSPPRRSRRSSMGGCGSYGSLRMDDSYTEPSKPSPVIPSRRSRKSTNGSYNSLRTMDDVSAHSTTKKTQSKSRRQESATGAPPTSVTTTNRRLSSKEKPVSGESHRRSTSSSRRRSSSRDEEEPIPDHSMRKRRSLSCKRRQHHNRRASMGAATKTMMSRRTSSARDLGVEKDCSPPGNRFGRRTSRVGRLQQDMDSSAKTNNSMSHNANPRKHQGRRRTGGNGNGNTISTPTSSTRKVPSTLVKKEDWRTVSILHESCVF